MASLMSSIDVAQSEKDLASKAIVSLNKFLQVYDRVVVDVKKLNNAIAEFPKEDPQEFVTRRAKFKTYEYWLDNALKAFIKELGRIFSQLAPIKDNELIRIRENIFVSIDNIVELFNQLFEIFQDPTKEFKNLTTQKIGEIVARCSDFRRMIKEELIEHLVVDIVGRKRLAHYEKNRLERLAKWHSLNTAMHQ